MVAPFEKVPLSPKEYTILLLLPVQTVEEVRLGGMLSFPVLP